MENGIVQFNETQELSQYEKVKAIIKSDESLNQFVAALGNINLAKSYVASVLVAVSASKDLQNCTAGSIIQSSLRSAILRLTVDPSFGHAYLVPFKDKCTLIVGYKGLIQLAVRTGKYRHLNSTFIYENQELEYNQLTGVHTISGKQVGKVKGYLCYFELLNGFDKSVYFSIEDIHAHAAKYSKSYPKHFWATNFEEMALKTVTRQCLSRWGYFDPNDNIMLAQGDYDEQDNSIDAEWMTKAVEAQTELMNTPIDEAEALEQLGFGDGRYGKSNVVDIQTEKEPVVEKVIEPVVEQENKLETEKENKAVGSASEYPNVYLFSMPKNYEEACLVYGENSKLYGDCDDKDLAGKMMGITKKLNAKDYSKEPMSNLLAKRKAILLIQDFRMAINSESEEKDLPF